MPVRPPLPHIPTLTPAEFEQVWSDAARLLLALDGAKLGAWYWDIESGQISWSRGAHALFGLDPDRPLQTAVNYLDLIHPDDQATVSELFERVLGGTPQSNVFRHRVTWPDGSLHWLQVHGSLQEDADGKQRVLGVISDVTEQQLRHQALLTSQEKFAQAFHHTPDAVVITELASGRLLEVNRGYEQQFGWSSAETLGRTSIEMGIWASADDRLRMLDAIADEQLNGLEVMLYHRSGDLRRNQLFGGKITLEGRPCLVLSLRDITQQREQEQQLQSSQERLNLALESVELGTWDWHIPSNMLFGSARAALLHGLPSEPFHDDFRAFFSHVPLHDRQAMRSYYQRLLQSGDDHYQVTYRTIQEGQAVRYLESTAKLYRDDSGQPLRMAGILLDITERVLRDQKLASSEAKFSGLFQSSPDPVALTSLPDGIALEINSSFSQTFGWQPDEVIGRTMPELKLWASLTQRQQLSAKAHQYERLDNEVVEFLDKQGRPITCVISSRVIHLQGGLFLITTFRDISERQQAEAELKASQEKFAIAFHSSPDAITITERDSGRYLEVNEGFCRLTGYSTEEVLGRSSHELDIWVDPAERELMVQQVILHNRAHNMEMRGRTRDGSIKTVQVSVEPIQLNNKPCLLLTARDVSELKSAQEQIQHLAYHDPLTNLPNRALLLDRLNQQIILLKRHDLRGALLFIDLDHFKHINDSLGHPVGDEVLKQITTRLQASVRHEDTVARLGGDEFVILISGLEGKRSSVLSDVRNIAEKLRQLLILPIQVEGHELHVTPSIGIALIPDHGDTPDDLLKRADIALYRAKDGGRNTIQLFRETMQTQASARLLLQTQLRNALERNEFELHFQPQVDASSNQIIGCEVLLRWNHPDLGLQSPSHFIPLLEESGLISAVGHWALQQACNDCAQLLQHGLLQPGRFSLCVNISPREFRQSNFVEQIEQVLSSSQLPSSMLKLEITEGIVIQNLEDTIHKMNRLKRLGVSFAMDDFGTGYSSLTYLKRLPVDVLKIDQAFVRDATVDSNDAEIVRAIIAMARSLGLGIIAEGVEEPQQLEFLRQLGCDHYQGYLFSRPLPLSQFRHMLLEHSKNVRP